MPSNALDTRRVLLVEDEPLIAMFAKMTLEGAGAQVLGPAASASAAVALLSETVPDLALVDVRLRGGEDGYVVADALMARGIPFVLATGLHPGEVPEAHRSRPVLTKPYSAPQLLAALEALLAPA